MTARDADCRAHVSGDKVECHFTLKNRHTKWAHKIRQYASLCAVDVARLVFLIPLDGVTVQECLAWDAQLLHADADKACSAPLPVETLLERTASIDTFVLTLPNRVVGPSLFHTTSELAQTCPSS